MQSKSHNLDRIRRRAKAQRRGFYVVAVLWFLVIGLLLAALVLNWAYFVTVQRDLQAKADALALASAPALLNDQWLIDGTIPVADVVAQVEAQVDAYRLLNNAAGATSTQIDGTDVNVAVGHVSDPAATPDAINFVPDVPFDSVKIDIARAQSSGHPVEPILQTLAGLVGVDVYGSAIARLDNQVVGVRPTATIAAPIVPIAIDEAAWSAPRAFDINNNQIRELVVRIAITPSGVVGANGAVVSFDGAFSETGALDVLAAGLTYNDLASSQHEFGPVTNSTPLTVAGERQISAAFADELLVGLGDLAASSGAPPRMFPIYNAAQSSGTQQHLRGFVAGRIVLAERDANQLRIVVEPCYLIHTTVWTDNSSVEFNSYIHKLVLVH